MHINYDFVLFFIIFWRPFFWYWRATSPLEPPMNSSSHPTYKKEQNPISCKTRKIWHLCIINCYPVFFSETQHYLKLRDPIFDFGTLKREHWTKRNVKEIYFELVTSGMEVLHDQHWLPGCLCAEGSVPFFPQFPILATSIFCFSLQWGVVKLFKDFHLWKGFDLLGKWWWWWWWWRNAGLSCS